MPGFRGLGAYGTGVQATQLLVALERKTLRGEAIGLDQAGAARQCVSETFPPVLVECVSHTEHPVARFRLAVFQNVEQPWSEGIVCGREPLDPLFEDLEVAQGAQGSEQLAWQPPHFSPGRMCIHFFHDRGDRTAAADSHPEIMNGIDIGGFPNTAELPEHTAHARRQPEGPDPASRTSQRYRGHYTLLATFH
jgi:hypothetical protein